MSKQLNFNKLIQFISPMVASIFLYVFGVHIYVIVFFVFSYFVVYFLTQKKKSIIKIYIIFPLILLNITFIGFSLIPNYNHKVETTEFYKKQDNYIKFNIQDSFETLKNNNTALTITNPNHKDYYDRESFRTTIRLDQKNIYEEFINNEKKILIRPNDTITFISNSKNINTLVQIKLWDGTILRIMPQSKIKVDEILKKSKQLVDSQAQFEVQQGNVWFHLIRTITNDDGFNMNTDHGSLVIRGTSGLINKNNDTTKAYSNDHLIEIYNKSGEKEIIKKGETIEFDENSFQKSNLYEITQSLGVDITKQIEEFNKLDKETISKYQNDLKDYIKQNFNWNLDQQNFLTSLSEFKMKTLSKIGFNSKDYKNKLQNLNAYKALSNKEIDNKYIKDNINQIIITPINDQLKDIKLDYLKQKAKTDAQTAKSYIINQSNKLIEQGEDIDINNLKSQLENIDISNHINNTQDRFDNIINN